MFKDIELGKMVNIIPSNDTELPNDIYTYFIDIIKETISKYGNDHKMKELMYMKVDRQMLKKIIMTIPYNATVVTIVEQLMESSINRIKLEPVNKKYKWEFESENINNKIYLNQKNLYELGNKIQKRIKEEYETLKIVFEYYDRICAILIKLNIAITWQPPPVRG